MGDFGEQYSIYLSYFVASIWLEYNGVLFGELFETVGKR